MTILEELVARVEKLEAVEEVRKVIRDYAFLHDQGRHTEMLELFEEDCIVEISGFGPQLEKTLNGHAEIFELYGGDRDQDTSSISFKHVITGSKIDVEGDEAVVVSYLMVTTFSDGTGRTMQDGLYQERLRRGSDGQWRFCHKRIAGTQERGVFDALDHSY
jgi:ketosteroid isomerase-like protein